MAEPTMEDVLDLIGGRLDDAGDAKKRFRAFLLKDKWSPEHFDAWLTECVAKGSASQRQWYSAMQDTAVAVGQRLGFEVEFGRYGGSTNEIAFDGLWRSATGGTILVEVKSSGWPVTSVGQLGDCVKRYAAEHPEGEVYGLYVVGGVEVQHIIDQIKGGEYRNLLRLISFEDLIKLWRLKADLEEIAGPEEAARRVGGIILPLESVNIGNLVTILLEIAELKTAAAVEEEVGEVGPERGPSVMGEPWEKDELYRFLADNTGWQNAFLTVLAHLGDDPVTADRVRRLINRVAERHMPALAGKTMTSVAGARAGFKMRRGSKEDFVGDEWTTDGEKSQQAYWLKPPYKAWIREWVGQRGWSIPES